LNKDLTAKLKDSFMVNLGIVIVAAAIFFFQVFRPFRVWRLS